MLQAAAYYTLSVLALHRWISHRYRIHLMACSILVRRETSPTTSRSDQDDPSCSSMWLVTYLAPGQLRHPCKLHDRCATVEEVPTMEMDP